MYWYLVIAILLLRGKQTAAKCNHEGKNCEWNVFTHECKCHNLDLTCVPVNILECPNPISLQLQDNNITRINNTDLFPYTMLHELILSNNQIKSIAAGSFQEMIHLEVMSLPGNQLTSLEDGVFNGLTSLLELYLGSNGITVIENNVFSVLAKLRTLVLSDNQLSALPGNIFMNLSELRILDLSSNLLTQVPVFNAMPKLTSLLLSENMIYTLPRHTISQLTGLHILYLDSNNISVIENSALANMIHLKELYLGKNNIRSLQPEIVWADGVETSDLVALKLLDIYDNNLEEISKEFMRHLPAIETLNLSGNQIRRIEASAFTCMDNLRYLKLRQNQLQYFDSDMFLDEETILDVTCRKEQKTFRYLQDINLAENHLESAPSENFFRMLPVLTFLEVGGNPLRCDCEILPMVNWYNSSKHNHYAKYYLGICVTPSNLEGIPITTMNSLSVAGPCKGATIDNRKSLISASPGEKVIINCSTSGNPKPTVCWDVAGNAGLDLSQEHITIQKLSSQHEGSYICHAENIFNNDRVTYKVVMNTYSRVTVLPTTTTTSRILLRTTESIYQSTKTPEYKSKASKLQTFTIIASILLFFTACFIIYMVRCHGRQVQSCQKHGSEPDIRNNRIARDKRRVYKTLVEERADESIEIQNLQR